MLLVLKALRVKITLSNTIMKYGHSIAKRKNLDELVKEEEEMVAGVRRLDSDVHQLVYENYNKFLTATSTVRKIQDEFILLDDEMNSLSTSMKNISNLIGDLSGVLNGQRNDLVALGSSYKIATNLQFIFDLPNILQTYLDEGKYKDIVKLFLLAQQGLNKYADISNVAFILKKTEAIVAKLEEQVLLMKVIDGPTERIEDAADAIELLLQLGKDPNEIQHSLLLAAELSLKNDLKQLENEPADILDLVDKYVSFSQYNYAY
uniref:Vacuolar protein sorting-associated protein 51 homolog n=1 Tax=Heterorhabditis bacteriophora TaxID=37862 RepID=A0A1I7XFL9_HETBA